MPLCRNKLTQPVPYGITHVFLVINVIAMTISSVMIIVRKHSEYAVLGLVGVVVTQALGYGLIFDLNFFLRNVSVVGGLLMVLSDSWVRKKIAGAGLPQMDEKDRKMYVQLAGRVLLICLFLGFVVAGEWTVWRVIVSLLGFVACIMVVVGFKAKFSAVILVLLLSMFNILVNNWWTVRDWSISEPRLTSAAAHSSPAQGLCQVRLFPDPLHCVGSSLLGCAKLTTSSGGLVLLVNMGPGQFSVDEKKKVY
jgi:ER-derived vesicles protein